MGQWQVANTDGGREKAVLRVKPKQEKGEARAEVQTQEMGQAGSTTEAKDGGCRR